MGAGAAADGAAIGAGPGIGAGAAAGGNAAVAGPGIGVAFCFDMSTSLTLIDASCSARLAVLTFVSRFYPNYIMSKRFMKRPMQSSNSLREIEGEPKPNITNGAAYFESARQLQD